MKYDLRMTKYELGAQQIADCSKIGFFISKNCRGFHFHEVKGLKPCKIPSTVFIPALKGEATKVLVRTSIGKVAPPFRAGLVLSSYQSHRASALSLSSSSPTVVKEMQKSRVVHPTNYTS
jgi:hypothetical protein